MKPLVAERQAEMARFSQVTPPPKLGTMPPFEMTGGGAVMRAMSKGELGTPNTGPRQADAVKGVAGSAGVVRGPARLLHSLAEAGKLRRGEVLVTRTTLPPWTPLFATAAAVVTDTGGVLCHAAVVAREYHIPAVVGTDYATSTFQDGQLLEVDGNTGTVRVVVEDFVSAPAALALA
jgi:pyruvate,water dikinase